MLCCNSPIVAIKCPIHAYHCTVGTLNLFGFLPLGLLDLVDILLVAFLMFKLYQLVRGTIAIRVFFGVFSFYIFWLVVKVLHMHMLSEIFKQVINVGVIALIIVFQQEIRKFLIAIGNSGFFKGFGTSNGGIWSWIAQDKNEEALNLDALTEAIFCLSETKTGALIAIQRDADLQLYVDNGKRLNAMLSTILLETIFFKNNPLHDGAVIVRGNEIVAAGCTLPMSSKSKLPDDMGMRHRAAIGLSEELDAAVLVVSEETGEVSMALYGALESIGNRTNFKVRLAEVIGRSKA